MESTLLEIKSTLERALKSHIPPLRIRQENKNVLEVCGTKERMQGKQLVDGYYFASVVEKPKDIRLYFFPIYTHPEDFASISPELRKCLKGKSCFHISPKAIGLLGEIEEMISKGIALYKKGDLI